MEESEYSVEMIKWYNKTITFYKDITDGDTTTSGDLTVLRAKESLGILPSVRTTTSWLQCLWGTLTHYPMRTLRHWGDVTITPQTYYNVSWDWLMAGGRLHWKFRIHW
jgi:hypothetical protein